MGYWSNNPQADSMGKVVLCPPPLVRTRPVRSSFPHAGCLVHEHHSHVVRQIQVSHQCGRTQIRTDISEVKNIMVQNIEKVLDRGEKIDLLVHRTDALQVGRPQAFLHVTRYSFMSGGTQMCPRVPLVGLLFLVVVLLPPTLTRYFLSHGRRSRLLFAVKPGSCNGVSGGR